MWRACLVRFGVFAGLTALVGSACGSNAVEVPAAVAAFDEYDDFLSDPIRHRQRLVEYVGVVDKCMEERGFTLQGDPVPPLSFFEEKGRGLLFGSVDFLLTMTSEDASELGLGFATGLDTELSGERFNVVRIPEDLDEERWKEYMSALEGLGGSGSGDVSCVVLAKAEVGSIEAPVVGDPDLAESLEEALTDGSFVSILQQWQGCLVEEGFLGNPSPLAWAALYHSLTEVFTEEHGGSPESLVSSLGLAEVLKRAAVLDTEYGAKYVRCRDGLEVDLSEEFKKILSELT